MTPAEEIPTLVAELTPLIRQLQALLAEPVADPTTGTMSHHKVTGSPAPWHTEAAAALFTIHAGVRDLEADLRYHVAGRTVMQHRHARTETVCGKTTTREFIVTGERGGSNGNTLAALDSITRLVHGVPDDIARTVRGALDSWATQARQVRDIGEEDRWEPFRAPKGQLPPACPYCKTYSLRLVRAYGRVRCANRACVDTNGDRPAGGIDKNRMTGRAMLAWADGRTIYYEESA